MVSGRNENLGRRIRFGMVGGGNDAFIGGVHRIASRIDDRFELVAGAFSSTPEKSRASGEALGVARIYDDFKQMAQREARRTGSRRAGGGALRAGGIGRTVGSLLGGRTRGRGHPHVGAGFVRGVAQTGQVPAFREA